jgi:hypothetical protein
MADPRGKYMLYELLVIADGPERGKISHAQPAPGRWGRKEGPPRFRIVTADVPPVADLTGWRWDFERQTLVGPPGSLSLADQETAAVLGAWTEAWIAK